MRKHIWFIMLILVFSFAQACDWLCVSQCIFAPNSRVTVRYPNGATATATANWRGCVYVSSRGFNCNSITVTGRRRSPAFGIFASSPDSVNIQAPPTSIMIYGYNMSTAYGMPTIEYNDGYGRTMGSVTASAVAEDGSWLQVNVPDLSYCYSDQFQVMVVNQTWDGAGEEVGYASVYMWGRDRPDLDGDGWFADQECDDNDANVHPGAAPDCTGLYYDRNCNGLADLDECNPGPGPCGYQNTGNRPVDPIDPCYTY